MNHPRNHAETQVYRLSFEVRRSSKGALFAENDFRSFWREKERKQSVCRKVVLSDKNVNGHCKTLK